MKNKNGSLFCQSLLELKFKDVRLRRVLKKIDENLQSLIADPNAALIVLAYAGQLPPSEMEAFVDYCIKDYKICLVNPMACRIYAKVFGKVSEVERLEIELHLKSIMPQIFDAKCGRELVEVFLTKADSQSLQPLLRRVYDKIEECIQSEDFGYFFAKLSELKKTEVIDEVIDRIFLDGTLSAASMLELINHETVNKVLLTFFTLSSLDSKDKLSHKLTALKQIYPKGFNSPGTKLLSLCENYFSGHPAQV